MEEEIVETLIARELATDRIECSSPTMVVVVVVVGRSWRVVEEGKG